MSRGHGGVQRFVLEYLRAAGDDDREHAIGAITHAWVRAREGREAEVSRSDVESVRRAVKSLARERLVRVEHRNPGGWGPPYLLAYADEVLAARDHRLA